MLLDLITFPNKFRLMWSNSSSWEIPLNIHPFSAGGAFPLSNGNNTYLRRTLLLRKSSHHEKHQDDFSRNYFAYQDNCQGFIHCPAFPSLEPQAKRVGASRRESTSTASARLEIYSTKPRPKISTLPPSPRSFERTTAHPFAHPLHSPKFNNHVIRFW